MKPEITLRAHLTRAGRVKSPHKAASSRANGAKGGRPRKDGKPPRRPAGPTTVPAIGIPAAVRTAIATLKLIALDPVPERSSDDADDVLVQLLRAMDLDEVADEYRIAKRIRP